MLCACMIEMCVHGWDVRYVVYTRARARTHTERESSESVDNNSDRSVGEEARDVVCACLICVLCCVHPRIINIMVSYWFHHP